MIGVYSLIIVLLLLVSLCHSDDTSTLINNNNNNDSNLTSNESSSSISGIDDSSIDSYSIDGSDNSNSSSISTSQTVGEEENTNNPFVAMLGDTLYKWNNLERSEIVLESTVDLLAKKKVIGIYYSASWYVIVSIDLSICIYMQLRILYNLYGDTLFKCWLIPLYIYLSSAIYELIHRFTYESIYLSIDLSPYAYIYVGVHPVSNSHHY